MIDTALYTVKANEQFTIKQQQSAHITFHRAAENGWGNTPEIGRLDFNGPELVFTGDAEESAKVFVEFVAKTFAFRLHQEWNAAIDAAAEKVGKVLTEDGRWKADVIRELKK